MNALKNEAKNVVGTYAMAAYAEDTAGRQFSAIVTVEQRTGAVAGVEVYDVTHAVSGRQKEANGLALSHREFTLPRTLLLKSQ